MLVCSAATTLLAAASADAQPQQPGRPPVRLGTPLRRIPSTVPVPRTRQEPTDRLFRQQDLGLLEAPDRDQWQKPDQIMDALGIAEGSVVAELGAGGGWFTLRLARRVGPNGRVYAADVQRPMIEANNRRVQRENLTNVTAVDRKSVRVGE